MVTPYLFSSTAVSIDLKILSQSCFGPESMTHSELCYLIKPSLHQCSNSCMESHFIPLPACKGLQYIPSCLTNKQKLETEICQRCESPASWLAALMVMLAERFAVLLAAVNTTKGMPLTLTSSHRRLMCVILEELFLLAVDVPQLAPSSLSWYLLPY